MFLLTVHLSVTLTVFCQTETDLCVSSLDSPPFVEKHCQKWGTPYPALWQSSCFQKDSSFKEICWPKFQLFCYEGMKLLAQRNFKLLWAQVSIISVLWVRVRCLSPVQTLSSELPTETQLWLLLKWHPNSQLPNHPPSLKVTENSPSEMNRAFWRPESFCSNLKSAMQVKKL